MSNELGDLRTDPEPGVSVPEIDAELGEVLSLDEERNARAIAALLKSNIERDYPPGKGPARRDAHPKAHGCVRATFRVEADLPSQLAQGAFVPGKSYAAWIRFSNGNGDPTRADAKGDVRGMAIKLLGVPGEKILPEEKDAQTQDFLMITHPVFITDDTARYLALFERSSSQSRFMQALAPFALGVRGMLNALATVQTRIGSPLEARYWSTTAYRLGSGARKTAVKYSARPQLAEQSAPPHHPDNDFLREVLAKQLAEREFAFDFLVQPRASIEMSVECTTLEWPESRAPFHKVATISIPRQTFNSPAQDTFCENLSFTPWHSLPEHRPLGSVNRVRRVVYEEISRARHQMNGVPRREPGGDETFES